MPKVNSAKHKTPWSEEKRVMHLTEVGNLIQSGVSLDMILITTEQRAALEGSTPDSLRTQQSRGNDHLEPVRKGSRVKWRLADVLARISPRNAS